MTTGIERNLDRLGRIVIPAEIRDRLGLNDRTPIDMSVRDGVLILSPMIERCDCCGRPVISSTPPNDPTTTA